MKLLTKADVCKLFDVPEHLIEGERWTFCLMQGCYYGTAEGQTCLVCGEPRPPSNLIGTSPLRPRSGG